ncbi:MAG: apolipoprotein N-acyltransferase [Verrucomicrobiae bacterium]|nr:apolipoprotein N-acyltransferase [Verrucomicrobiae bacterium]
MTFGKTILHALLSLASALTLATAYPPLGWGNAVWFALVPLIFVFFELRGVRAMAYGWAAGFCFYLINLWWISHVTVVGTVILCAYLALYWGAWAWLTSWILERHPFSRSLPNIAVGLVAAAAWVVLEWVRGHLMTGFPWNPLAVALYEKYSFIQIARLFGTAGISFLVVFVNMILALTFRRFHEEIKVRRLRPHLDFSFAMLLVALTFAYGIRILLNPPPAGKTVSVAVVQGNIPQYVKWDAARFYHILDTYHRLTRLAAAMEPDIILWPESSTPGGFFDQEEIRASVTSLTADSRYTLIFGTDQEIRGRSHTGAMMIGPGMRWIETYQKMHLVPFGEFAPFSRYVPLMHWLVGYTRDYEPGDHPAVFTVPGSHLRVAPLICFEDVFPYLARQRAANGAELLVNLTNDAWFLQSVGPRQHLANAVFRAIETGRPLIRSANTGWSALVDSTGRVREEMTPFVEGFALMKVGLPAVPASTFYSRHGDVFVLFCALILLCGVLRKHYGRPDPL